MEWLVGAAVVAVLFFVWQGFRVRCPLCGTMALHPRDQAKADDQQSTYDAMKASGLLDALNSSGSGLGEVAKPGYENRAFRCKSCDHRFTRRVAIEWLTIANKVGEGPALAEYKKLDTELKG